MSPAMPAKQWNQAVTRAVGVVHAHASRRATAQAAPKPLSMPTTVTPDAQEASMASRAVTPSSPAP